MPILNFLLRQILAFGTALIGVAAADQVLGLALSVLPGVQPPVCQVSRLSGRLPNWATPCSREIFDDFLRNHKLVLFGSSELTTVTPYQPSVFLPQKLGIPTMAFGHAGAQSLSILNNLLQHQAMLGPRSRLVVLVSPWWFIGDGIEVAPFFEYSQPQTLLKILFDPAIADRFKKPTADFLARHGGTINGRLIERILYRLSPKQAELFHPLSWFLKVQMPEQLRAHSAIYRRIVKPQVVVLNEATSNEPFDWDQAMARTRAEVDAHSQSNPYGVEDARWKGGLKASWPHPIKSWNPKNHELQDLQAVAAFLHTKGVPALFILLPLHAQGYTQLEEFKAAARQIAPVLAASGMDYVNWLERPFEKQDLLDLAHPSDYGLLKINREIEKWFEDHP